MSIFETLAKEAKNEYAKVVSETNNKQCFVGTGSYILNAMISGSINGGIPDNRITAIAGEQATGKTFYAIGIAQHFLETNPDGAVFYFDSESAVTSDMFQNRGLDENRVWHFPVDTIEEFRTQIIRILDNLIKTKEQDRKPLLIILDSLGMLASSKELDDALSDKQVRDMTKSQLVKGAFRMLTLKLGQAKIPLIVTNHTYDVIGSYVPTKEMGGGSGLKYAASTIIYLSKKKEKDGKAVIGNIVKAKTHKSRLSKENKEVEIRLYYDERGLDKYYGLLELGEIGGLWKNVAGRYEIGGKKIYAKQIYADPETYFDEYVMQALDEIAQKEFSYGES